MISLSLSLSAILVGANVYTALPSYRVHCNTLSVAPHSLKFRRCWKKGEA
jgi:hypothetical protein